MKRLEEGAGVAGFYRENFHPMPYRSYTTIYNYIAQLYPVNRRAWIIIKFKHERVLKAVLVNYCDWSAVYKPS